MKTFKIILLFGISIIFVSCSAINNSINSYNKFAARFNLEQKGMPINKGDNPPNIAGTYLVDPCVVEFFSYGNKPTYNPFTIKFTYSKNKDNKDVVTFFYNDQEREVTLSGEGNKFTASILLEGYSSGKNIKKAVVISGEKTSQGIKNIRYGEMVYNHHKETKTRENKETKRQETYQADVDYYEITKDGDGLAESMEIIQERERQKAAQAERERLYAIAQKEKQDSIARVERARQDSTRAEQQRLAAIEDSIARAEKKRITKPLIGQWKSKKINGEILTLTFENENYVTMGLNTVGHSRMVYSFDGRMCCITGGNTSCLILDGKKLVLDGRDFGLPKKMELTKIK
jgi:hypothetical protein